MYVADTTRTLYLVYVVARVRYKSACFRADATGWIYYYGETACCGCGEGKGTYAGPLRGKLRSGTKIKSVRPPLHPPKFDRPFNQGERLPSGRNFTSHIFTSSFKQRCKELKSSIHHIETLNRHTYAPSVVRPTLGCCFQARSLSLSPSGFIGEDRRENGDGDYRAASAAALKREVCRQATDRPALISPLLSSLLLLSSP